MHNQLTTYKRGTASSMLPTKLRHFAVHYETTRLTVLITACTLDAPQHTTVICLRSDLLVLYVNYWLSNQQILSSLHMAPHPNLRSRKPCPWIRLVTNSHKPSPFYISESPSTSTWRFNSNMTLVVIHPVYHITSVSLRIPLRYTHLMTVSWEISSMPLFQFLKPFTLRRMDLDTSTKLSCITGLVHSMCKCTTFRLTCAIKPQR